LQTTRMPSPVRCCGFQQDHRIPAVQLCVSSNLDRKATLQVIIWLYFRWTQWTSYGKGSPQHRKSHQLPCKHSPKGLLPAPSRPPRRSIPHSQLNSRTYSPKVKDSTCLMIPQVLSNSIDIDRINLSFNSRAMAYHTSMDKTLRSLEVHMR
jgi:hypothetical protein